MGGGGGVGGNQSWLTADIGFHSECGLQIKKVTAIDESVVPPWYQDGIRVVPGWYQSGTRVVSEWYVVPLYTRHIRKYTQSISLYLPPL